MQTTTRIFLTCSLLAATLTGCSSMSHTQRNSLIGSTAGTTAGAVIGHQSGHGPEGAVIGALAGGVTGALVGNAQDAEEVRDVAIRRAEFAEDQLTAVQALTNADLVRLRQTGMSDDIIINAVRDKGGRFDLSADGLIALKQAGISDAVIREIQAMADGNAETTYVAGTQTRTTHFVVLPHPRPVVRWHSVARPRPVVRVSRRGPVRAVRRR